jgi:hypothetical protein
VGLTVRLRARPGGATEHLVPDDDDLCAYLKRLCSNVAVRGRGKMPPALTTLNAPTSYSATARNSVINPQYYDGSDNCHDDAADIKTCYARAT